MKTAGLLADLGLLAKSTRMVASCFLYRRREVVTVLGSKT